MDPSASIFVEETIVTTTDEHGNVIEGDVAAVGGLGTTTTTTIITAEIPVVAEDDVVSTSIAEQAAAASDPSAELLQEFFPCGDCGESFVDHKEYQDHSKDKHEKKVPCQEKEHTWKPYYIIHTGRGKRSETNNDVIEEDQDGYHEFECPKCPFIAPSQEDVDGHVESTHKTARKPRVKCQQCSKTFARKYELQTHVKKVHLGIKDQKCPQCDYATADKGAVMKHLKAVHWDER